MNRWQKLEEKLSFYMFQLDRLWSIVIVDFISYCYFKLLSLANPIIIFVLEMFLLTVGYLVVASAVQLLIYLLFSLRLFWVAVCIWQLFMLYILPSIFNSALKNGLSEEELWRI